MNTRALATAFWTLAILTVCYTMARATTRDAFQGYDLLPLWKSIHAFVEGGHVYTARGAGDFLYPPSAILLLLPLGIIRLSAAKAAFFVLDLGAILLAAILCLRLFDLQWKGWPGGATLLGLGLSWPFFSTLHTENVNGLVLLGEAIFLLAAARAEWNLAGVALGMTLALKPVLAPLLVVVILYRRWRALALAAAIPVALSGIVLLLSPRTRSYFDTTLPLLFHGQDRRVQEVSVSLRSVAGRLSFPHPLTVTLELVLLAGIALLVWQRWSSSGREPRRLVELSSIVLIAGFLLSSFSFRHYGLYLLPLALSVADPKSPLRSWIGWTGLYAIATMDYWNFDRLPNSVNEVLAERFTIGLVILLVAIALGLQRDRRPRRMLEVSEPSALTTASATRSG